jgi:hypothetical protein
MLTLNANHAQTLPDLAAGLTDRALESLGNAGSRADSVEAELALWRALTAELKTELCDRRFAPRPPADLNQVVDRATRRVASRFSPA